VFRKGLRDQRWQIAGFGMTLALIAALDVLIWPSYRDALQNLDLPSALQALIGSNLSIATPAGFLSAEFFSWTPILLIVYAIIQGTGAVGGDDGAGTLELLLAQPISRSRVVIEKTAVATVGAIGILLISMAGFALTVPFIAIDVQMSDVCIAVANLLPITLLFFALALWLGALLPARGMATALSIGFVTAAWVANTLAQGVSSMRGLEYVTPFHYYGAGLPLVDGIAWGHVALLLALAALFVALALHAVERRDVGAGGGDIDVLGAVRRRLRAA
jgi:ABC-2 type transport system permease protein